MAKSHQRRKRAKKTRKRKLSVMVLRRIQDTMELSTSVAAYQERLAAAMAERYSPCLRPGEELPDYALGLELQLRDAQVALGHLIELDDAVAAASTRFDLLRREQDRLLRDELYPRTVSIRGSIDLAFGRKQGVHLHGLRGRTQRSPEALEQQIRRMIVLSTQPDSQRPPAKNPHASVDLEGRIGELEPLYQRLVDLNREIGRQRNHAVPKLVAQKQAAMDAFDAAYRDGLRSVTAAFKAARFDTKVLKNLRPYYQRRRLSRRAAEKRRQRAAAGTETAPKPATPSAEDSERVTVPKPVVEWLEKNRLFGT